MPEGGREVRGRLTGSRKRPGSSVGLLLWVVEIGDDGTEAMKWEDVGMCW